MSQCLSVYLLIPSPTPEESSKATDSRSQRGPFLPCLGVLELSPKYHVPYCLPGTLAVVGFSLMQSSGKGQEPLHLQSSQADWFPGCLQPLKHMERPHLGLSGLRAIRNLEEVS